MADKRISQLVDRGTIENNDVVPIVVSGATTTNKATISSIQTFMQENLDVGVTSVGITLGSSGTDVSVSGSPITTSGNITINIPDASATARGVVTTESQTFGGVKTFANGLSLPSAGGGNQITRIVNIGSLHQGSANLNQIGFNSGNNIYFGKGLNNGGVIQWTNSSVRYYTLPDADGTIALTSQLDGYVTLNTAQTITAQKVFNTSGSSDSVIITHGSGSGIALDVIKAGNGEAIRVNKTSGAGNAMTISGGNFEAGTIVKTGGTSSQFLKADGSVDSNTYLTTASASAVYVPYTGANSNLDLGQFDLDADTIRVNGSSPTSGSFLGFKHATTVTTGASGYTSMYTFGTNIIAFKSVSGGTNKDFSFDMSTITSNVAGGRVYSMPDASGTLALTSNLSAYLPLTGGTLTGALNGTSASFTGAITSVGGFINGSDFRYNPLGNTNGNPVLVLKAPSTGVLSVCSEIIGDANVNSNPLTFRVSNPDQGRFDALTLSSTGAATFISSVTATTGLTVGSLGSGSNAIITLANNASGSPRTIYYKAPDATINFTGTGGSDQVTITNGGNVGIGTASPTRRLQVEASPSGGIEVGRFVNNSNSEINDFVLVSILGSNGNSTSSFHYIAATGSADKLYIFGNGNVVNANNSYGSLSDIKLKENIQDATPKLDDLMKVKVRNYNLIGDDKKQIGVIAQELEEVFPAMIDESEDFEEVEVPQVDEEGNEILNEEGEVVTENKRVSKGTTTKSVKYSVFVPMLIKAIQELKTEIDSLKNQMQ